MSRTYQVIEASNAESDSEKLLSLMGELLNYSDGMPNQADVPAAISVHLPHAHSLVDGIAAEIGNAKHGAYFDVSRNRYAHYFAAGMAYLKSESVILDIGNAPGHVGIGFTMLGHTVRGLNLNANWRSTYPNQTWFEKFNVIETDLESSGIPVESESFDAILFTEVLEHVGIKHPLDIIREMHRILKPGGVVIFSTPNVCNISNIYALLRGKNIFWAPEIFYGSLDRHNREYTPQEVETLMRNACLDPVVTWGLNDYSNWRGDGADFAQRFIQKFGAEHPLCRNTIAGVYRKKSA
ncbi:bifunctional 2-polyprenyl-6-hydroxyphenol methylase/3-demethylubiquinol 3-O-methyltransferase UbiG [Paraburkholderia sp. CNPSo 3281]|uniref:class I SAM-dependent methyltransferase n=1 Tax=Paraburkholderia sp. CNPSo 3281 TaxID=2940933 RepID=UPI0020B72442|nr:class I SAM-dependent methyltransferase [Paraburkholderia sp. CNPSo 3281]MCP3718735.1 class I SAM-dependent methyltransferase [Paraburkholderia sp. CNPSo 3281]